MTNHPNRATKFTAYNSQDGSIYEAGLSRTDALALAAEKNDGKRSGILFWMVMTDADFARTHRRADGGAEYSAEIRDGIERVVKIHN